MFVNNFANLCFVEVCLRTIEVSAKASFFFDCGDNVGRELVTTYTFSRGGDTKGVVDCGRNVVCDVVDKVGARVSLSRDFGGV